MTASSQTIRQDQIRQSGWISDSLAAKQNSLSFPLDTSLTSAKVTRITAGSNVSISPTSGVGNVTVSASGGGSADSSIFATIYNAHHYADSVSRATGGVYNVKLYGAKGNGIQLDTVSISSGNDTLTTVSSIFSASDTGKVICVDTASSSVADLVTTISSVVSGTKVVLSVSASHTVTGGVCVYGTDDGPAIQSAVNAAAAAHGGVVFFPAGIYIVNSALQNTGAEDAQIVIPMMGGADACTIMFQGETAPHPATSVSPSAFPSPMGGSIIKSTLTTGAGGNVIAGGYTSNWTYVLFGMKDIIVRTVNATPLTAVNLQWVGRCVLRNVEIASGEMWAGSARQPQTMSSYGLKTPGVNNGALTQLDNVTVEGFTSGILMNEHTYGGNVTVMACFNGLVLSQGYHAMYLARCLLTGTQVAIRTDAFTGNSAGINYLKISQLDIEHEVSPPTQAWQISVGVGADFYDPSDYTYGTMNYNVVLSGSGYSSAFVISGGTHCTCTSMR